MMTVTWVAVAQKAEWDINYRLKSLDTIYNSGWVMGVLKTSLSLKADTPLTTNNF